MDMNQALIIAGLVADLVGVIVLFVTTATRKIEAEIAVRMMEDWIADAEGKEGDPVEHQRTKKEVQASRRRVDWNNRFRNTSLIVLAIGFLLQIIGQLA